MITSCFELVGFVMPMLIKDAVSSFLIPLMLIVFCHLALIFLLYLIQYDLGHGHIGEPQFLVLVAGPTSLVGGTLVEAVEEGTL